VLGGYVESERNLSQKGDAWVHYGAWVFGNAHVFGNAQVCDNAQVSGNARVFGNTQVCDNAQVSGNALVFGNAWVFGTAQVSGNALVFGNARVFGNAQVFGNAEVSGNAHIKNINEIVNFIISFKFSITITPDNIVIGCQLKKRSEWLKVTKKQAIEMGLPVEMFNHYKTLVKTGMKLVPKRKNI
jgi:carbonic anhydrase/acetyltransferase-like protein (isoleucine patch superfamily)